VLLAVLATSSAMAAESPPLTLQTKIPLGDVRGRIDHLAIDHARQRLFVAEFGNNSLGVVDLKTQIALTGQSHADEIDWAKVDAALGKTASVQGDVHRYGIPRSGLQVTVDGVTILSRLAPQDQISQHDCIVM